MAGDGQTTMTEARLGDVADLLWGDTSTTKASYTATGFPAYSASGRDGFLPYADFDRTGVVVSAIGAECGKTWLAKGKWSCIKNTIRFWSKVPEVDTEFLYWLTSNPNDWPKRGSAQPFISQGDARAMRISYPPLAEQKAIAAALGALDDKIELNRRMNATLEAMARALFQSWFVDFDPVRAKLDGRPAAALFPAHFDHKAEGVVPTGWRATTLGEVIEIFDSKRIPLSGREREARKGMYPYHGAASVMDYVDDYLFDGIYALMGEDGSVINDDGTPVLQYVWGKFWVNNHAHVLRGKNGISTEHLLLHLKGCNIAPFVNGAVQPKLNQGNMNRIPFILPPPEIGQAFAKAIDPLFAQIRANTEQSRTLANLRDTLLPKLLSGALSMATIEN